MKEFMDFATDDARCYWIETYVGVKKDDHYEAYYIDDVQWSGKKKDNMFFMHRGDDVYQTTLNDPDLISYVPELGMKQIGDQACYFTKAAARQWKKGLRTGQYNSKYVNYMYDMDRYCNMHNVEIQSRDNMFNPTHCDLSDALQLLRGKSSIALSTNFAIAKHPRSNDPVLCYREELVGKVIKGELYLLKEYDELSGSLTDEVGECHAM